MDGDDSEDEWRFTVAHEVSHYILEVHTHRERAERLMDRNYLAVLYGSREPTDDDLLDAWLKRVRTTPFAHLMDRAPDGGHGCGQTLSAECDADALAVEMLAPRAEMARAVRANRHLPSTRAVYKAALAARRRYGLPPSIATEYANRLVWRIRGGPSVAERFGFTHTAAL